jgi:peptidoglycan L-alanyl-D-glutamate endopeptidase CwlK
MIDKLHPKVRPMAIDFIAKAKTAGIDIKITAGLRTFDEQEKLYNQGRTTPGKIVTKAKPGQSFHNYGLAIDVVPIVHGKAVWEDEKLWQKLGVIGESAGFEWGGRWKFVDKPHFQFPRGTKYTTIMQLKMAGDVDQDGYVILSL